MRALVTASFWMLPVGTGLEEPMRLHGGFTSASQVRVLRRARAADLHSPGPSGLLVFRSVGRRAALVSVLWPGQAVGSRGSGSRCRPQSSSQCVAGWSNPTTFKAFAFWQGLEQGCGGAGRGPAQGNRSPRSASRGDFPRLLPPTQQLPPLVLEWDQALPAKSSWLYNSAPGWAAPVSRSKNQAEPRM